MDSLKNNLNNYQKLLQENNLQSSYRKLISYLKYLQVDFKENYPKYEVAKGFYEGYLDLSFFTFTTEKLKVKQLKISVVFLHSEMRFEAWLSGRNRSIMSSYNKKLKGYNLGEYKLASDEKRMVSVIEGILITDPNFDDLKKLTKEIQVKTVSFVNDIEMIIADID